MYRLKDFLHLYQLPEMQVKQAHTQMEFEIDLQWYLMDSHHSLTIRLYQFFKKFSD